MPFWLWVAAAGGLYLWYQKRQTDAAGGASMPASQYVQTNTPAAGAGMTAYSVERDSKAYLGGDPSLVAGQVPITILQGVLVYSTTAPVTLSANSAYALVEAAGWLSPMYMPIGDLKVTVSPPPLTP